MYMRSPYDGHLGHSIKRLYQLMGQYFNAILRPYGVASSQWYVLYAISQSPQLTQKELQAAMQVESATLTGMIDVLVHNGWVERKQSAADRRVKELRFTPTGRELWEKLPDPIIAIRTQMLSGISAEDEEMARKILDKAIQNFESIT
jgi:DNA-binding MarR family transcriptional regulator